jgi:peroxiredoxin/predicted 2-oxoglutarate/Fe(II)-dependent dioxygenase YbiX
MLTRELIPGEPAPWFTARSTANERFHFDTTAGRYVVMMFFGSAGVASSAFALAQFMQQRERFDDLNACFFGVSVDPDDEKRGRVQQSLPGIRFFWDFDLAMSQLYRAVIDPSAGSSYRRFTLVLDERLRIVAVVPLDEDPRSHVPAVMEILDSLSAIAEEKSASIQAPVLVVPRLFEPELCRKLIDYHDQNGGQESGFMREIDGKTVLVLDPGFKRRRDQDITDTKLRDAAMHRIHDRLIPEIHKAFQFIATRIERHIVACYDGSSGGYFNRHRDNTTKGTAHRRFAVSLNLNTGEYEGGKLRFPEFGRQTYEAPAGGAVVFSCSLLHEATPVTSGRRYAYLPFLYDDEAAKIRERNLQYLALDDSRS